MNYDVFLKRWQRLGVTVLLLEGVLAAFMVMINLVLPAEVVVEMSRSVAGDHYADVQAVRLHGEGKVETTLHLLPSLVFVVVGLGQLHPRLRRKHLRHFHRWLGRLFIVTAIGSSITGTYLSVALNYSGWDEVIPSTLFGIALIVFCLMGWVRARQRDFQAHQEWMILALASGLGITLARMYLAVLTNTTGLEATEFFGSIFWMGSGTNVVLALVWFGIRKRVRSRQAASKRKARVKNVTHSL